MVSRQSSSSVAGPTWVPLSQCGVSSAVFTGPIVISGGCFLYGVRNRGGACDILAFVSDDHSLLSLHQGLSHTAGRTPASDLANMGCGQGDISSRLGNCAGDAQGRLYLVKGSEEKKKGEESLDKIFNKNSAI